MERSTEYLIQKSINGKNHYYMLLSERDEPLEDRYVFTPNRYEATRYERASQALNIANMYNAEVVSALN